MEMAFTQLLATAVGLIAIVSPLMLLAPFLTPTEKYRTGRGSARRDVGSVGINMLSRVVGVSLMALGFGQLTAGLRQLLPGLA